MDNVQISQNAAKRIAFLMETEPEGSFFRIAVDGGGCSGFQYQFHFDTVKQADDIALSFHGITAYIDPISLDFVKGSELDYIEELGAAYFAMKNPNATASCGCGNSFAT